MALTTEIIIGIIIAGLIYVFIHRTIVQRATRMVRRTAQDETDVAMTAAVQRLVNDGVLTVAESDLSPSAAVADVWGRGVMAFEYHLAVGMAAEHQVARLEHAFNEALAGFSVDHQVKAVISGPAFVVSDIWVYEERLHVDVAYLMNESTVEYLKDLKKIDSSSVQ